MVWVSDGRPQEFLDELVRLEGRGDANRTGRCKACANDTSEVVAGLAAYSCDDCFGACLECHACILRSHARLPFHRIQVRFHTLFMIFQNTDVYFSTGMTVSINESR